jgi:hypothetical protein
MPKFEFEIVGTVEGGPDPLSYEPGLSRTRELDGAAKVVVEEFPNADIASSQACCHEEGHKSEVWQKHCPRPFQFGEGVGGLDVYYLGPVD